MHMKKTVPAQPRRASQEDFEYDDEVEETATPPRGIHKKPARQEEEASAARKTTGATSLEDYLRVAIDRTSASGDADNIPAGSYEAMVTEIVMQPFDPAKGQSLRMKFQLCGSDWEGKKVATWFKILDAHKQPAEFTIGKLKGVFAKLGYKLTYEAMDGVIEEIKEAQPGVILKINYQNVEGTRYQRVEVMDICDNDVIQEFKDRVGV